jgi:hypothetical protein
VTTNTASWRVCATRFLQQALAPLPALGQRPRDRRPRAGLLPEPRARGVDGAGPQSPRQGVRAEERHPDEQPLLDRVRPHAHQLPSYTLHRGKRWPLVSRSRIIPRAFG